MTYRIELQRIGYGPAFSKNEYAYGVKEVKTFLNECIEDDYIVEKIIKTTKDGRGYDVTDKYIKKAVKR